MLTVLLTFTGFHDPFAKGLVGEEELPGPVVTLAREVHFDRLVLFSTPGTAKHSAATREAVNQISPDTEVQIEDFPLLDPTDYQAIRKSLLAWIGKNRKSQSVDEYCVSIASGTPQMHVTWLTLVASGELKARILNTRPPRYVTKEKPLVSEIRVFPDPFPLVTASVHDAGASEPSSTSVSAHSDAPLAQSKYTLQKGERPITVIGESRAETAQHDIRKAAEVIGMIGDHPEFLKILEKAGLLAPTRYPVLILGETGTGKELLARLIHLLSGRAAESFIPLNCAAIPKD
jgi:sigma54-dependent transcription regulator